MSSILHFAHYNTHIIPQTCLLQLLFLDFGHYILLNEADNPELLLEAGREARENASFLVKIVFKNNLSIFF